MNDAGGTAFLRRALRFLDAARRARHPHARWLAAQEEISVPTARRVINRLRDDFGAPLIYSDADRGWELRDPTWTFAPAELTHRRELIALAVAMGATTASADPEVAAALETFWQRLAGRLDRERLQLDALLQAFSSDWTEGRALRHPVVIDAVDAVAQRRLLRFAYTSPWAAPGTIARTVKPLHVRSVDGTPYLLAEESSTRRVFNLSYADGLTLLEQRFDPPPGPVEEDWAATFGAWQGGDAIDVVVRIAPPDARYVADQRWHSAQHDRWDGEILIRTLRAHHSPELIRHLLRLGPSLLAVQPDDLRQAIATTARELALRLEAG